MKGPAFSSPLPFLRTAALVDLAILAAVVAVCWLFGWRSIHAYGTGLFYAGIATTALGLVSLLSSGSIVRRVDYLLGQTVAEDGLDGSVSRPPEAYQTYSDVLSMAIIEFLAFVAGLVIQAP